MIYKIYTLACIIVPNTRENNQYIKIFHLDILCINNFRKCFIFSLFIALTMFWKDYLQRFEHT